MFGRTDHDDEHDQDKESRMLRRRGRLLGTVARTAVIAGTATATANAVNRHGQQKAADQQAAAEQEAAEQAPPPPQPVYQAPPEPPPAAAAPAEDDLVGRIQQLAELRDAGVLSEEEFAAAKGKVLGM
jgi:hemolysin activation/secretion protein